MPLSHQLKAHAQPLSEVVYIISQLCSELVSTQHSKRYCCFLQGCVIERLTGKAYAIEDFQEVIASIITAGMKMNKRTHALQLMVYLQEADLDVSPLPIEVNLPGR